MNYTVVISVPSSSQPIKYQVQGSYSLAAKQGAAYARSVGGSVISIY